MEVEGKGKPKARFTSTSLISTGIVQVLELLLREHNVPVPEEAVSTGTSPGKSTAEANAIVAQRVRGGYDPGDGRASSNSEESSGPAQPGPSNPNAPNPKIVAVAKKQPAVVTEKASVVQRNTKPPERSASTTLGVEPEQAAEGELEEPESSDAISIVDEAIMEATKTTHT